jgi:hypothetical protein
VVIWGHGERTPLPITKFRSNDRVGSAADGDYGTSWTSHLFAGGASVRFHQPPPRA